MIVRALDLFCGGGGSSWGARAAKVGAVKVEIAYGIDADPVAMAAYARNFGRQKAVHLRMTENTTPSMLRDLGEIHLLLASPECTNHTCARGSRPIDESSRETARYVVNFAKNLKPKPRWVIIENVIQMKRWDGYGRLLEDLRDIGYRVADMVLDAQEFGVPQQRRRLFVICDLEREPPSSSSIPRFREPPRTVADSILVDPPGRWPSSPLQPGRAAATIERADRAIATLGKGVPFLIVYYGSDASGGWQRLDRPLRTITTIDRFGLVTWCKGLAYLRMLQVPELMRAMGYDDSYDLVGIGTRRDQIRLLGNGVAPPVMKAVVRELIRGATLGRVRTEREHEVA